MCKLMQQTVSQNLKFIGLTVNAEKLFNALKAIETLASGTMKVYGLPSGPRAVHKPS